MKIVSGDRLLHSAQDNIGTVSSRENWSTALLKLHAKFRLWLHKVSLKHFSTRYTILLNVLQPDIMILKGVVLMPYFPMTSS